jgi:hypothetical protein
MSYSRWSATSSVYVFAHVNGQIQCCGCLFLDDDSFDAWSTAEMVAHIREHIAAGHTILDTLIEALEADDEENFPKADEPQPLHSHPTESTEQ